MVARKDCKIIVSKDGPYMVSGRLPLKKEIISSDENGDSESWKSGRQYPDQDNYSLCRCGKSRNRPFCDSSHNKYGFDGTETASRKKFSELAEKTEGPGIILKDNSELCAGARFCHNSNGRIWELAKKSGNKNTREIVIGMASKCPSGRLVIFDRKTGKAIEPDLYKSISITEDPERGVSGPIWLKGKIPVESSEGFVHETRNRVTLCRCGKSRNKPFCDCSHIESGFNDGDENLR